MLTHFFGTGYSQNQNHCIYSEWRTNLSINKLAFVSLATKDSLLNQELQITQNHNWLHLSHFLILCVVVMLSLLPRITYYLLLIPVLQGAVCWDKNNNIGIGVTSFVMTSCEEFSYTIWSPKNRSWWVDYGPPSPLWRPFFIPEL